MANEGLRQKLTARLSKDPQGVVRTLKSAGIKLSSAEEAGISKGNLDQFSDAQLGERFNSKVLGMLGISGTEQSSGMQQKGKYESGNKNWDSTQGKQGSNKTNYQNKKNRNE